MTSHCTNCRTPQTWLELPFGCIAPTEIPQALHQKQYTGYWSNTFIWSTFPWNYFSFYMTMCGHFCCDLLLPGRKLHSSQELPHLSLALCGMLSSQTGHDPDTFPRICHLPSGWCFHNSWWWWNSVWGSWGGYCTKTMQHTIAPKNLKSIGQSPINEERPMKYQLLQSWINPIFSSHNILGTIEYLPGTRQTIG